MNSKVKKTSIVAVTVASFAIFAGSVSAQQGPGNGGPGGAGGPGGPGGRPPMERPMDQNGSTQPPFGQSDSAQPPFGQNDSAPLNEDGSPAQPPFAQQQGGERPDRPGVEFLQSVIEATGLTGQEIQQQLQDGATIDEILAAAGTSVDEVIDQAVADGVITEEQAQIWKDRIAEGNVPNLPGPIGGPGRDRQPIINTLNIITELTDLDAAEIRQQLQDGATLDEILLAAGTSLDEVIDQAVTEGLLTEEQAADLKEHIAEGDFPNLPGPIGGPGRDRQPIQNAIRGAVEAAVELTGLDATEIRQQLQDGASIKEILEANGSSVDALVDVLVAEAETRLDAQVESGRITEEQAADRLAELETRLTERLNEGRPMQGEIAPEPTQEAADA